MLKERNLDVSELVRIIEMLNFAYIDQPGRYLINQYVLSAFKRGIDNVYTDLVAQIKPREVAVDISVNFTRYDQKAIDNLSAVSLSDLHGFTSEMSKKIVRDLVEADKKGAGITKFTEIIQDHYAGIGAARAESIARTVSTQAHNEAAYSRIEEYAPFKGWIPTVTDHRTRPSHLAMKGVVVAVGDPFRVPGFKSSKNTWVDECEMMYPGDSSLGASAAQIINCRCAVAPQFRIKK
jgi:uncharacterized protein with gpF-like domain